MFEAAAKDELVELDTFLADELPNPPPIVLPRGEDVFLLKEPLADLDRDELPLDTLPPFLNANELFIGVTRIVVPCPLGGRCWGPTDTEGGIFTFRKLNCRPHQWARHF